MVDIHSLFGTRFDRVNVFYSNPDYYTEQKSTEASNTTRKASRTAPVIEWPEKTDDFFPYSDCPHCFWTGFFTSRAAFKRFERTASSFLLAARQIDALPMSGGLDTLHEENYASPLSMLEEALAVAQHHDAVSGTAKQHVADDYSKRLSAGMAAAAEHVIEKLKRYMLWNRTVTPNPLRRQLENLSYCPLLNETICRASMVRNTNSK